MNSKCGVQSKRERGMYKHESIIIIWGGGGGGIESVGDS